MCGRQILNHWTTGEVPRSFLACTHPHSFFSSSLISTKLFTIPFSLFLSLLSFLSTHRLLVSMSSFLSYSCYCPFSHLALYLFITDIATNAFFPTSSLIPFFFFLITTEGFLPTSIIHSGACCSLALSIEVLFSTYCIFRERNVTAFLVMKLLPFDIIRLRKHSAGCLGDI